jgi:hypothetical protein
MSADRTYAWTAEGQRRVLARGVTVAEVDQALAAPAGLRVLRRLGDALRVVIGMAHSGRVIAVVCTREAQVWWITDAGALSGSDLDEWRKAL